MDQAEPHCSRQSTSSPCSATPQTDDSQALAWCPWQANLLATGGGTHDQTIHFWSSTTGARTASLPTASQVTSLVWSPHSKELLSTHGFPDNNICLWSYPSGQKIWDVPAHDARVLSSCLSPDGMTVATGAGDENLKVSACP
jgi:cell division cycle protein 20 (cofactor of APC complex)